MRVLFALLLCMLPLSAQGQDRLVRLFAPDQIVETGVLKFAMPRFSLKTQVKVELVGDPAGADMVLGPKGTPLFDGLGQTWSVEVNDAPAAKRLLDWLQSDVGQRTIFGFAPDGGQPIFAAASTKEVEVAAVEIGEDAIKGKAVARQSCARCHAVDDATRMTTIGSTPSFFVLRTFEDWEYRFSAFYVLKPHGAFTQVKDLTEPFPIDRPSPIVPIELTQEEVEAIVAYVAALAPADLGSPIQHQ